MDSLADEERERFLDVSVEVRIWDKFYDFVDFAQDYIDLEFSFIRNGAGGLSMLLPGDTAIREHIFENPDGANATIPITVDTKGMQWPGKIDTASIIRDADGVETIEITALHDWEHVSRIAMWPSPFAPLQAQFPRRMVLVGPTETVIKTFLACNLLRLQLPLWRVPDMANLFDPSAWFDLGNAMFPIAVVPVNPLLDTTKWTAMSARMQMGNELFAQSLKDAGLVLTAKLYIHGESEQPCPEWFILDRTTIVLDVEDHSGVTGPTGTVIDGLLDWFVELAEDGVTQIFHPILDPDGDGNSIIDDFVGIKHEQPHIIWHEGQYSSVGESEVTIHKPIARDVIVGGKSPGWVNAGIEVGIRSLLSALGLALAVPGLDALYQGQLSDVFLAFQRFTDAERARQGGPYMYQEYVDTTGGSAYTIDAMVAGRSAVWDTRGYVSHSITVHDGSPFIFGTPERGGHFSIGHLVGFELNKTIYTDYVTKATFKDSRDTRATWTITIGDGSDEEGEAARSARKISSLFGIAKDIALDTGADLGLGFI
ncbi:phage tail protein [Rhodococcus sp. ACS1]|nr:phage tail protein [Rhodococcus sp. ACS1]